MTRFSCHSQLSFHRESGFVRRTLLGKRTNKGSWSIFSKKYIYIYRERDKLQSLLFQPHMHWQSSGLWTWDLMFTSLSDSGIQVWHHVATSCWNTGSITFLPIKHENNSTETPGYCWSIYPWLQFKVFWGVGTGCPCLFCGPHSPLPPSNQDVL